MRSTALNLILAPAVLLALAGCGRLFFDDSLNVQQGATTGVTTTTATDASAFTGVTCDQRVTAGTALSVVAFEALLSSGASPASPYTVCLEQGVTVTGASNSIDINATNLRIIGPTSGTAPVLTDISIVSNGAGAEITLENLTVSGDGSGSAMYISGTSTKILKNSTVSAPGTTEHAIAFDISVSACVLKVIGSVVQALGAGNSAAMYLDAGGSLSNVIEISGGSVVRGQGAYDAIYLRSPMSTLLVTDSTLEYNSSGSNYGCVWVYQWNTVTMQNSTCTSLGTYGIHINVQSTVSVNDSVIQSASYAIRDAGSVGAGGNTINLKDSVFRRYKSSAVAAVGAFFVDTNNAGVPTGNVSTWNETSTGAGNLVCNVATSLSIYDRLLDTASQTHLGTFDPNNTQNGSNTAVGNCP